MKTYIVGNWKMNQSKSEIDQFFKILDEESSQKIYPLFSKENYYQNCEAWIAPQFVHLDYTHSLLLKYKATSNAKGIAPLKIEIGAQNCSHQEKGAFTGDVSAKTLPDVGCTFVIIGHSERRAFFKETPLILKEKVKMAVANKLTTIFCIGETLEEREKGIAFDVVREQLIQSLKGFERSDFFSHQGNPKLLLAYEPVWAIGTGKTATPLQAQEMHQFIRAEVGKQLSFPENEIPILYGGSVNPENIEELLKLKDINGALVGGASLKPLDYAKLYLAATVKIR